MPLVLFALFVGLPILELYVIIQVGGEIGVVPTLALLFLTGFAGAVLARSQGRTAWRRLNQALAAGKMPGREVVDGAMIMLGGALLLSPGFITDAVGIGLLLPPGRAAIRSMLKRAAARTPAGRPVFFVYDRYSGSRSRTGGEPAPGAGPGPGAGGPGSGAGSRPPRRSGSRGWDVEGEAREIGADEELPSREQGQEER